MILVVKQQDPPIPKVIEGDMLEKLIVTMSGLYDSENKVLDLSALHKNAGELQFEDCDSGVSPMGNLLRLKGYFCLELNFCIMLAQFVIFSNSQNWCFSFDNILH